MVLVVHQNTEKFVGLAGGAEFPEALEIFFH